MKFISLSVLLTQVSLIQCIPNIIGGTEVKPQLKYPFIASLQFSGQHFCGGTALSINTILTAAHCAEIIEPKKDGVEVHLLRHSLSNKTEELGGNNILVRKIKKIIVHEGWSQTTLQNDIAILHLVEVADRKPLYNRLKDSSKTIALSDIYYPLGSIGRDTGSLSSSGPYKYRAIGWGANTFPASKAMDKLQEVTIRSTLLPKCQTNWKGLGITVTNKQICYGEYSKDTCKGDSGGPIVYYGEDNNTKDKVTLVGIVSFAAGCATGVVPSVGTRVSEYADFINKNII